jgi:hypothetical protein
MKLPILSAKEIIKALEKDGFRVIRSFWNNGKDGSIRPERS